MNVEALLPLLLVLPMAGFLFTAFVGRRLGKRAHWVPVGVIFLAWVIAMVAVFNVLTGSARSSRVPRISTGTSSARGLGSRRAASR
jgi:NADH:ubiquinone oxidoreductase subunit 5 (subunit L)/multisubunit Na+/H+ antiporter MnhA subunit